MKTSTKVVGIPAAGGVGAFVGFRAVRMAGMSAVGVMGGGKGFGAKAGPVAMIFGATAGIATWGLTTVVADVYEDNHKSRELEGEK